MTELAKRKHGVISGADCKQQKLPRVPAPLPAAAGPVQQAVAVPTAVSTVASVVRRESELLESNVLTIKTVQVGPMRTMFNAIDNILVETNIVFTEQGIFIINIDKTHNILVNVVLHAANFELYDIRPAKIVVNISVEGFAQIMSTLKPTETLTLFIAAADYNGGCVRQLGIMIENGNRRECKKSFIRLLEVDPEVLTFPDVHFSSIMHMASRDFQSIVNEAKRVADRLTIRKVGPELSFRYAGEFIKSEITRFAHEGVLSYSDCGDDPEDGGQPAAAAAAADASDNKVIQGEFALKNLAYFTKCTSLCPAAEIYFDNDLPLVVKYKVAALGYIQLCLVPIPVATAPSSSLGCGVSSSALECSGEL
jgi:proliferating cell nuclear antigen PCNA